MVNTHLSFNAFCGLKIEDDVPDHSTLSRFRSELVELDLIDKLFNKINKQLKKQGILIEGGSAIVDATIIQSPYSYSSTYIAEDREEPQEPSIEENTTNTHFTSIPQPGSDADAGWLKKGKKTFFGYKNHIATDHQGLILGVHTVSANQYEGHGLAPLLDKVLSEHQIDRVLTDKGYTSQSNRDCLKKLGLKDGLMKKGVRGKELTCSEKLFNKEISQLRYVVERTFGSCKKWFNSGECKYKGLQKTHFQNV